MPKTTVFDGSEVEYVEVHDEPFHRWQFNNDFCWIYITGIRPGETSLWHRHSQNTLYVCVQNACAALNRPSDKEPFVHHATPGDLWWALSKTVPYVHQVCLLPENPHPSKFFAIEILRPLPSNRPKTGRPIEHPCYRLRRDDSRAGIARVYDFQLRAGESTGLHSWSMCGVILCLAIGTGGRVESNAAAEPAGGLREEAGGNPFEDGVLSHVGGWKWVDEPVSFDVRNNSDKTYEAIVVEWLGEEEPVDGNARL